MLIATHSGTFHADDCFAYAMLRRAIGEHLLSRTRDPDTINAADFVFDVGGVYDHSRRRYDHHMKDRPLRDDGVPYSSAGLIWRHYGRAVLVDLVRDETMVDGVWQRVDSQLVVPIDRFDNGVGTMDPGSISAVIHQLNPDWDEPRVDAVDFAFQDAVDAADRVLVRSIEAAAAHERAKLAVKRALETSSDPRVLELPVGMPWEDALFALGVGDVLFAISPSKGDGGWHATAVPDEPGSFAQRLPFPEEWRGLRDAELQAVTGIDDAVFCHPGRFICGAKSKEGVMRLVQLALALAPSLTPAP